MTAGPEEPNICYMATDMDTNLFLLIVAVVDGLILFGSLRGFRRSGRILRLLFFAVIIVSGAILIWLIGGSIRNIFFPFPPA